MNEDTHLAHMNIDNCVSIFAVFDGHGGPCVSEFCEDYFIKFLRKNGHYLKGEFKQALTETCLKMDELMLKPK